MTALFLHTKVQREAIPGNQNSLRSPMMLMKGAVSRQESHFTFPIIPVPRVWENGNLREEKTRLDELTGKG